ncbi:hypothetical protein AS156_29235 [Bradyrhizobium macuxiense]|uniref:Uncharacterized protein n=1 Tax=Bradyrhizobium macuxiense TaxID=1755647 RepID=A0A109K482_9BRAD|nr:patatin-like phospholipase family protein [Bradyrhizobium macuxiense]KWV60465.1 hypothetical protein AS156_29235 [Bradyrhizobium macuxiense]
MVEPKGPKPPGAEDGKPTLQPPAPESEILATPSPVPTADADVSSDAQVKRANAEHKPTDTEGAPLPGSTATEKAPTAGRLQSSPELITDFRRVYLHEYCEITQAIPPVGLDARTPSTSDGMIGIALSGGGIRSASFCLGVLQALNAAEPIQRFHYLSTVSGGGYIGTSMTVSMAYDDDFPFGKTGRDPGETVETGHLRDHSRYLLQDGLPSAISAVAIYLRGLAMNIVVILPFLLFAAGMLALVADTRRLDGLPQWPSSAPEGIKATGFPWSILALGALFLLLVVYALIVSVWPIVKVRNRKIFARAAGYILFFLITPPVVLEAHFALLRLMFGVHTDAATSASPSGGYFENWARIVAWLTPVVLAVLPFVRSLADKALTSATKGISDAASKWTSRIILVLLALVIPLLLWVVVLQLAYWAIGVSACAKGAACGPEVMDGWRHAPSVLVKWFGYSNEVPSAEVDRSAAFSYFGAGAILLVLTWPFFNVNSNSLHQLYRDRLGRAFLFRREEPRVRTARFPKVSQLVDCLRQLLGVPKRQAISRPSQELRQVDTTRFSEIKPRKSPYHLINTALNVPGSRFANRRGRNADFFVFSRLFVGSEATGYVDTALAERVTDGLNIGTAMAISGAAAAPNMGIASMRPLSPTIAFFNVRLGRWLRHPADIVRVAGWWAPLRWWLGRAGPVHLLKEAFFKSGTTITDAAIDSKTGAGFVFLTDGGHIENLGIYELLRRRCRLIVAVDGEADPDMMSSSLVQLQRFARIDLGTTITMDWQPIAKRSLQVSEDVKNKVRDPKHGPHVALGLIDYPPLPGGTERETGVLIYLKSSLSGDENDYVAAYKAAHPAFPHESTMEQLFSEEQFECYRALGEHIGRRMISGEDPVSVSGQRQLELLRLAREYFPNIC